MSVEVVLASAAVASLGAALLLRRSPPVDPTRKARQDAFMWEHLKGEDQARVHLVVENLRQKYPPGYLDQVYERYVPKFVPPSKWELPE